MLSVFHSKVFQKWRAKKQNNGICITNVYISVFGKIKLMTISLIASESDGKGLKYIPYENVQAVRGTTLVKRGFAHMQKHGVIMDVTNVEQAQIAEEAGAVAVMVLDKLPYDVRKAGGVARTASVKVIEDIMDSITIPIMAKCRIGHTMEAKVLEFTGVDMVDESEVLTPADEERYMEMGLYCTLCKRRKESWRGPSENRGRMCYDKDKGGARNRQRCGSCYSH